MTDKTIDLPTFRTLQETAGAEFVGDLVGTFLEEAPAMLAGLAASLAAGDGENFRRTAHSLKSNSLTFGALALAALAKDLELAGLSAVQARPGDPLAPARTEYARVAEALEKLRHA
jgi:HPt (histidine-containing phosphotransfer) domain-containing protein